jgi:predicted RNase H-like HicB family nuclease
MTLRIMFHRDEDGVYIAECPALPGCVSQGATRDEAIESRTRSVVASRSVRSAACR